TWPRPPLGFLLWSGLNLALAAYVARGLARRFPRARRRRVAALLVTCFPLAMGIFVGQPTGLLVLALYQSYLAFERGDEGRAGLWAGLLFVKPQYVTGPLLVLLGKRRWRALAGAAAAEAAILAGSLVVGGLGGIAGYLRTFVEDYPAYRGGIAIDPTGMINWRGLLTTLFPRLPADAGLAATALLSLATLALLPLVWRGRWDPRSPLFAPRFLATMMVTLLIAYHSQLHGAALLAIPGAIALASQSAPRLVRAVLLAGLFGSPVVATLSGLLIGNPMLVAPSYVAAMAVALGAIVWAERGQPTGEAAVGLEGGRFAAAPAVARRLWSDRGPRPGGPSR
ncbi:MAG: DUF2029 domain-containing protein, partial [Thermomicrobiaceae bacterium]|nr:DUF2029 domain-containing protein [Thermomicrobiaceae bacterium]